MKNKNQLEKILKVNFRKATFLKTALTHRSWVNEHKNLAPENNERLEFLGDAILEFWTTKTLISLFPALPEGSLTNIRAAIVRTENLAEKSRLLALDRFLLLGRGEEQGGGRKNPSLLADAFEAVIGAIFMDQGLEKAEAFLKKILLAEIKKAGKKGDIKDAKTILQEKAQERKKITPQYKVVSQAGPEHEKVFRVGVFVGKNKLAVGEGRSKKEAEETAAKKALTRYRKQSKIQH